MPPGPRRPGKAARETSEGGPKGERSRERPDSINRSADVLSVEKDFFRGFIRIREDWLLRRELKDPRAMGELVFHVEFGIVGSMGLPHFPDDF